MLLTMSSSVKIKSVIIIRKIKGIKSLSEMPSVSSYTKYLVRKSGRYEEMLIKFAFCYFSKERPKMEKNR